MTISFRRWYKGGVKSTKLEASKGVKDLICLHLMLLVPKIRIFSEATGVKQEEGKGSIGRKFNELAAEFVIHCRKYQCIGPFLTRKPSNLLVIDTYT